MRFDLHQRAALVIAHPGHELRVYGWLEKVRPVVFVLTDGSGHSGISRLNRTAGIISQVDAMPGGIFGRFTDAEIYAAILQGDFEVFYRLVDELCAELDACDVGYVAGDASEGFNPAHDLCRLILNTALRACGLRLNRRIGNFEFSPIGRLNEDAPLRLNRAIAIDLDDAVFQRKLQAANNYIELKAEVEAATKQNELSTFRTEHMSRVCQSPQGYGFSEPPFYERYGEQQVAAGAYQQVLRYQEHMRPIAIALQRYMK